MQLAERLGFHSVWTAEAYGADAMTPLAAIAATTERIKLGTAVVQLAGRPPAMLGMQAMTVDALAGGGRMIVGIGLSGPQIVEGWYGQPWGKPNARLRDYVTILRDVLRREGPVTHDGPRSRCPTTVPARSGRARRSSRSCTRRPTSRSGWRRSVPATPSCARSSATDGCRWACPPEGTDDPEVAARSTRGFARRTDGRDREDFESSTGSPS